MQLSLDYKMEDGVEVLEQNPFPPVIKYESPLLKRIDSLFSKMQSFFGMEESVDSSGYVHIKKVSDRPYELIDLMRDCIARDKKETDSVVVAPSKDSMRRVLKIITPEKPKDSMTQVAVAPIEKKADSITILKTLAQRKNKEQKHIVTDVKTINLKVYDNAIMDGDTVSILYNGKMLLTHQLLSEKGIELTIELDENNPHNEIILFAESLGSIPPNTALIVVTAGTKRYELFASASLEENAVLVFDYKPK
jgi:hypothetical protein